MNKNQQSVRIDLRGRVEECEAACRHRTAIKAGAAALGRLGLVFECACDCFRRFRRGVYLDDLQRFEDPTDDAARSRIAASKRQCVGYVERSRGVKRALAFLFELLAVLLAGEPDAETILEFDLDEITIRHHHLGLALGARAERGRPEFGRYADKIGT